MEEFKDVLGNKLNIGDNVWYARKRNYTANGELVNCKITKFIRKEVRLQSERFGNKVNYTSTSPKTQIIKI